MFIGHYGAAFGLKSLDHETPLWIYLLGVQLVDIFFFAFVLLGIEKMNIVPGYTAYNSYDLYCMPYTHSLLGNVLWFAGTSLLGYIVFKKWFPQVHNKVFLSLLIGFSVFSHFITDLLVHTPDLPLWSADSPKIGLGLWNYVGITIGLELLLLLAGIYIYYKKSNLSSASLFNKKMAGIALFMMLITVITPFMPEPYSPQELAIQGLISFFLIAGMGYWLENKKIAST